MLTFGNNSWLSLDDEEEAEAVCSNADGLAARTMVGCFRSDCGCNDDMEDADDNGGDGAFRREDMVDKCWGLGDGDVAGGGDAGSCLMRTSSGKSD